ncbi:MAG: glycosyltransferase [Nitrospiraceae bacterium]|nr:glycosyltransferase [Nitrospiraceae bacterium]
MVELIEAVNATGRWQLIPLYENRSSQGRRWSHSHLNHEHVFLDEKECKAVAPYIKAADLVVIGHLWGEACSAVLKQQMRYSKPFVFWGERPGAVRRSLIANAIRPLLISRRFSHAKAVWGIGEWAVKEYKRCLPSVEVFANMPYASNLEPYFNIPRDDEQSEGRPVRFLYSGSLIHRKGVDLLMPAFLKLVKEGHKARLTLMGHGELENRLISMIPQEYKGQINFIGFKEWHELPSVYAQHDILVAPSRYDGWGLIVVEGLASGMPVIATDMMGATIDFVKQGENGWVALAGDGDALYNILKEAVNAVLPRMRMKARASVECWTLDKAAGRWCELADTVLTKAI